MFEPGFSQVFQWQGHVAGRLKHLYLAVASLLLGHRLVLDLLEGAGLEAVWIDIHLVAQLQEVLLETARLRH